MNNQKPLAATAAYTDDTIIKFGTHKGKALADIPDSYLLWLYNNGKAYGKLKAYIIDNLDAIKVNCKEEGRRF